MLSLSIVVAIAASGAAFFIVCGVVAVVVWVRFRKERHALRVLRLTPGENTRKIQTFAGDTLTELSHQEGSVLRAHGQLPYGKPTEWGKLESRETLLRPKNGSETSWPLMERARSLRNSIRRARSKRFSRTGHKRVDSMATVSEMVPSPPGSSRENIPLSAVEGVLELPAERTPQQTPEIPREEEGFHLGMRPMSPASAWPPTTQRAQSTLFPVLPGNNSQDMFDPPSMIFDESPTRLRGGSIVSQTAGHVPDQSIPPPPPPAAFPQERFSYLRNDSVMRLSSMSLDTTNSSILDDGRNGPRSADTDLTSPIFPSGGTFVPYSANDVGVKNGRRSFIAANTSLPPNFPIRSSSNADNHRRMAEEAVSPRRSMTTTSRNPSNASSRSNGVPRRSESMSSNPPQRHSSLRNSTPGPPAGYQKANSSAWRSPHSNAAYVLHFSQYQQQPPGYENEQFDNDPFYGGSPASNGTLFSTGSPGQPLAYMPQSPMQRSSLSIKGPLPSALKGSNSQRKSKGHRRQNCVRISIHPPMTFGGSVFSPTVEEEPEDLDAMEEVDLRESTINGTPKAQPSPPVNTSSPLPRSKRGSGSRRTKPVISAPSSLGPLAEEPQPRTHTRTPSKKRKKAPTDNADDTPIFARDHSLPGIFTALPPSGDVSLSHTPSPEREPPVWAVPGAPSPLAYENSPASGTGSPRRTAVKGPRTQPGKPARSNSTRAPPPRPIGPLMGPTSSPGLPFITGTQGSDWRRSTDTLHRTQTDASNHSYRRYRESQGSLASALDSSMCPTSPVYGTNASTVRDKVTIWEDANRSGSPPKPPAPQFAGNYAFPPDTNASPVHMKNTIPRSISKSGRSPARMASYRAPPTPTSARRGMTTPTGKGLGIGIGCATPVSLYDGDGFFRE
ncbi:uncharacterized protein N7482_003060 [Penicillium canariense]|uniref:Uncharacterized protein n=1 Tax=Penicillium canariense TaxID=189055 RepID=A0A9W9LUH5_9EURO|nr:uncharacterized protein N7482_003060 [Penicillium canariense]KAJ5177183.1 hypothetical protein N7482_003060 [Penicillium canariense]